MRRLIPAALLLLATNQALALGPDETIRAANEILRQAMARQIPASLLNDAQGVVIVPDVIKIGFVAAVRRGYGVAMVRDANNAWTLPQFVTLTGGSVGWQAGIQSTDVVLVFMSKKSVMGLLNGKFTIGADASAAAGPVGRNAAAATDARLRAEILSYSRSRGLFAGVSLDGSAIELDPGAQAAFYGAPPGITPLRVPESALQLVQDLAQATQAGTVQPGGQPGEGAPAPVVQQAAAALPQPGQTNVRQQLSKSATQLSGILDEPWQKFLALPPQVFTGNDPPPVKKLQASLAQFDKVVQSPEYESLVARPEFQATYTLLREYTDEVARAAAPQLALPPPPGK